MENGQPNTKRDLHNNTSILNTLRLFKLIQLIHILKNYIEYNTLCFQVKIILVYIKSKYYKIINVNKWFL